MKYPRSRVRSVEFTLGLFACVMIALAAIGGLKNYSPVPFWDMWDATFRFVARIDDGDYSAWWGLHNEHRIVLSRILFWLDYKLFGGTSVFLIVINYLLVCVNAGVFWQIVKRVAGEHRLESQRLAMSLLITGWLFVWTQYENLTWAFQSQFLLAQILPLCALFWLYKSTIDKSQAALIMAAIFGLLSAGTMANGILVLPLMFVYSLFTRQSFRARGLLLVLSAATTGFYFVGYETPPHHGSLARELVNDPIGVIHYTALYLGSPCYFLLGKISAAKAVSAAFGMFLMVATAVLAYRETRKPQKSALNLALVFYIIYVGGTAFGTGGGRLLFGIDQVLSSRYTTPATMAWVALLILLWANGLHRYFYRYPRLTTSFTTGWCLILLNFQVIALENQPARLTEQKVAALAMSLGVRDVEYIRKIYYNLEDSAELAKIGTAREYSIFARHPYANAARDINTRAAPEPAEQCLGNLDVTTRIDGDDNYLRLHGWLYHPDSKVQPELIRFLNDANRVVGFALTGMPRYDVAEAVAPDAGRSGFIGYLLADASGRSITAVGDRFECQREFQLENRVNFITVAYPGQNLEPSPRPTISTGRVLSNQGYHGSDFHRSLFADLAVYGSFVRADSDTGQITIAAGKGDRFYFRSGPTTGRQLIRIADKGWEMILPGSTEWVTIELTGKLLPVSFKMQIIDNGSNWGEWSAIALLKD